MPITVSTYLDALTVTIDEYYRNSYKRISGLIPAVDSSLSNNAENEAITEACIQFADVQVV